MSAQSKFFTALTVAACLAAPALSHADPMPVGALAPAAASGGAAITLASATAVVVVVGVSAAAVNNSGTH